MHAMKAMSLFAATVAGTLLLPRQVGAADAAENCATNPSPLKAEVKYLGGPGLMPVNRAFVTAGTNKFTFLMPDGFRLETSDPQKLTLVSADFNCLITWRIVAPAPPEAPAPDQALYRELLLNRHPGSQILQAFTLGAAGRLGPAFDLRWGAAGGLVRRERVLFISCPAGVMEFSLVSSLEKFDAGRQRFDAWLVSFRASDEHGHLAVPMISNLL
jgi:hypothetical protein